MDHQSSLQSALQSGAQPRSNIPRLSKLPVPRASFDSLRTIRPMVSRERSPLEQAFNLSALPLPRPSDHHQPPNVGLFWSADSIVNAGFEGARNNTKARNDAALKKPFGRPALRDDPNPAPAAALAPSHFEPRLFANGQGRPEDEYPLTGAANAADENEWSKADIVRTQSLRGRRRPRPSISDRTFDSLSQLSHSHSPGRRRSKSFFTIESPMGPPARPASSVNNSRSGTPFGFRISRPCSPTKHVPVQAQAHMARTTSRPPAARRASNPARPKVTPKPESIAKLEPRSKPSSPIKKRPEITKPNPFRGSKTLAARPVQNRPGLTAIFRDSPRPSPSIPILDSASGHRKNSASETGASTETSSESSSTSPSTTSAESQDSAAWIEQPPKGLNSEGGLTQAPKSSAALREIISKAKAEAARKAAQPSEESLSPDGGDKVSGLAVSLTQNPTDTSDAKMGLLRERLAGARKDGSLNIAAMSLKQIPDEVMRIYDVDFDSGVTWAETVDLTKFIAADNELTSLREDAFPDYTAAELAEDDEKTNHFGGLEVLDVHANILQTIPMGVRRLERLRMLDLSNNALTMPAIHIVSQMEWLVGLNLANNNLSGNLPPEICHLMSLQSLDLRNNRLESLPEVWQFLGCLQKFNVSNNKLSHIPWNTLADLPPLIEFDASKNNIQGTFFSFFSKSVNVLDTLQVLNLSFNSIDRFSEIEDIRFPELHTLALDGNRLTSLPDMSLWAKLLTFTASDNRFAELPEGFVDLKNLRNVDMSGNSLTKIDARVGFMESIVAFNLASNPLRDRKYLSMPTDELKRDLLLRGPPLIIETVINSEGTTIFEVEPPSQPPSRNGWRAEPPRWHAKEGTLDLSFRSLSETDLHPSNMILDHVIFTLKVSRNILTVFPLQLLTSPRVAFSLKTLDLSHNPIREIPESLSLPHLQSLSLASTSLNRLDILCKNVSAPDLTALDISRNRITGPLPRLRDHFPKLTVLNAADNGITTLSVEAVRGLSMVDVTNNDIGLLEPKLGLLAGKDGLQTLAVTGNRFRVPNRQLLEKGTEAVLTYLRGRIPEEEDLDGEWSGDSME